MDQLISKPKKVDDRPYIFFETEKPGTVAAIALDTITGKIVLRKAWEGKGCRYDQRPRFDEVVSSLAKQVGRCLDENLETFVRECRRGTGLTIRNVDVWTLARVGILMANEIFNSSERSLP